MKAFDDPWRALAKAARQRDWTTIDAILEDRKLCGSRSVRDAIARGINDARKESGEEAPLVQAAAPNVRTIHDLTPEERSSVKVAMLGGVMKLVHGQRAA